MRFIAGNLYHVYNQGNDKQVVFFKADDYLIFLRLLRKYISPYAEIVAYCLMPNHFHLLLYTDERVMKELRQGGILIDPLTNGIRKLLSGYARIFNSHANRSGSLFRQKTKSKCLSDMLIKDAVKMNNSDYFENCFHYIHQNPLKAKLVNKLCDWEYSSYRDYAELRTGSLCNRELAAIHCNYSRETFFAASERLVNDLLFVWSDRDGQTR